MSDAATAELSGIAFRDANAAARNLARVSERVPANLRRMALQLLAESPDPDAALNLLERLAATAGPELFRLFERHNFLLHYAITVFGYSQFLGETLIRNQDLFQAMLRDKKLDLTHSRDEFHEAFARFRSRSMEHETSLLLARFKRREYVRIMLRDVLKIATLAEATAEISALADVLINEALLYSDARLRDRYGPPQHVDRDGRLVDTPFAVFSLGKLGGNELNYSSDIDLLFLHGDGEAPPGAAISNREYFIRLAQQITEVLSKVTREGAPFRIDLRLRPQGGEGEPAVGLSHAIEYYAHRAHDWERQALIKLRYSAGDQTLAREFIRKVQPFVYTEQLNFAAIETALETRERIGQHRRRVMARGVEGIDVKLDRGGIRDIEFLVQCLQRVYGGTELWLRSGGTLFSLQKLHDKGHISGKEFQDLTTAYEFLRTLEHRLQLRHDQQTHRLPANEHDSRVLARMIFRAADAEPESMLNLVRARMKAVAEIYGRIVHQQQAQQREDAAPRVGVERRGEKLWHVVERLAADSPDLYAIVQRPEVAPHARKNLTRFLSSAYTSPQRYAAVAGAPAAVERALQLFATSDYLTETLVRHPEDIELLNTPTVAKIEPGWGREQLSYQEQLGALRRHYRRRVLVSGARDVMEGRPVYESLSETSAAADETVAAAYAIAGAPGGFAVLALGRLGTCEADLLSDADLLFVRDESLDGVQARRTAERIVEALSAYTRDGTVFAVDARLRPRGAEGELVVTPAHLADYLAREAQPWEALTYSKLRYITGSREAGDQALASCVRLTERFGADRQFLPALREMRAKLEKLETERGDVKNGAGGLYDIDFVVSSLLVRTGLGESGGNLRQRLCTVHQRGLVGAADHATLDASGELLRTAEHVIRLVTGRNRKTVPVASEPRAACEALCSRVLKRDFPDGLTSVLRATMEQVREIYSQLMTSEQQ